MFQGYDHSRSVGNFRWQWLKCWWWCHVWKGQSASSSLRYEDLVSRSWGQPGNLWNLWVPQLVQPILWQIWWLGLLRYYPCWGRVQTKLRAFSLNVSKCWPHQMNREPISEGIVELFVKTNHLLRGHPHYCALVTMRLDNDKWDEGFVLFKGYDTGRSSTVMAKKEETTLLVILLTKSFLPFGHHCTS